MGAFIYRGAGACMYTLLMWDYLVFCIFTNFLINIIDDVFIITHMQSFHHENFSYNSTFMNCIFIRHKYFKPYQSI